MISRKSAAALLALAVATSPAPLRAETPAPPAACQPFAITDDFTQSLVRLCARLIEADAMRSLTPEETDAARRLGDYLAVLARLELRAVPDRAGVRLRAVRRTSAAARYLIADHLGLIALANRLAPAV